MFIFALMTEPFYAPLLFPYKMESFMKNADGIAFVC